MAPDPTQSAQPWETLPVEEPLPAISIEGDMERAGARIWYGSLGSGSPVILLHGGMASSRSWGHQVQALIGAGHRVILIDSRGHGRSTLGDWPLSYELMAGDVLAVMDAMGLGQAAIVGWSDGAIIGLVLAMSHPDRLTKIYAFGANMDRLSLQPDASDAPILGQLAGRLAKDYAELSPTPEGFAALRQAVRLMQKAEPNYSAEQLAAIYGPRIMIASGGHDEFIKPEHQAYLARTIPGAKPQIFPDASHFAPWQQPDLFNASLVVFLDDHPA